MLNAAYLAFNLSLLNEDAGPKRLVSPDREEHWVRRLFEKAVRGFLYSYSIKAGLEC